MKHIRAFLLGIATVYGVQYITKKRYDGTSIWSDAMKDPRGTVKTLKYYTKRDIYNFVKGKLKY